MARIMNDGEFIDFLNMLNRELGHMKPGERKRLALMGAVEGYGGEEIAFTGDQLKKIFDLGFQQKQVKEVNQYEDGEGKAEADPVE